VNIVAPAERDIYGSIGIGYGDLLVIGGDAFGSEARGAAAGSLPSSSQSP
jgi:hypothetical protein